MTAHQLGALVSRVFGLYFLVQALNSLPSAIGSVVSLMGAVDNYSHITLLIVYHGSFLLIYLLLAALFWLKAEGLGRCLAGPEGGADKKTAPDSGAGAAVLMAAGFLILSQAIKPLLEFIINVRKFMTGQSETIIYAFGVQCALLLAISLLLIFGARGILNLVKSARHTT